MFALGWPSQALWGAAGRRLDTRLATPPPTPSTAHVTGGVHAGALRRADEALGDG